MKLIMQAVRALLNKVNAVLAEHERSIAQLTGKMAGLKGQKTIVLNLQNGSCNLPFSKVAEMEPAEIQACLTVTGNVADMDGCMHRTSVMAVDKVYVKLGEESYAQIMFILATGRSTGSSGIIDPVHTQNNVSFYAYNWTGNGYLNRLWAAQAPGLSVYYDETENINYICRRGNTGLQSYPELVFKTEGGKSFQLQVGEDGSLSTKQVYI